MLRILIAVSLICALVTTTSAVAQQFNIDIDSPSSPPALGGGVPSSTLGAAADQAGFWNSIAAGASSEPLFDLSGGVTGVTLDITTTFGFSTLAFNNPINTGDFALLFNDAHQIGTLDQGGTAIFEFSGLTNGAYQVYTYAVQPQGGVADAPVLVDGSTSTNPQIVTGPMPGDAFALGMTHALHNVAVTDGTLTVSITVPPNNDGTYVNAFQIVPEPGTLGLLAAAALLCLRRKRFPLA